MSSARLVELLEELGYPGVRKDVVAWLFSVEGTQPFLKWLCGNLTKRNALTASEVKRYQDLVATGRILQGAELEAAMVGVETTEDSEEALARLRREVEVLRNRVEPLERRQMLLTAQRDRLQKHSRDLQKQVSDRTSIGAATTRHNQVIRTSTMTFSSELDEALSTLVSSTKDVSSIYCEQLPQERLVHTKAFLSADSLDAFFENDVNFTRQLRSYVDGQFNNAMGVTDEVSHYTWLKITNPEDLGLQGESARTYTEYCAELTRLMSIYEDSVEQWINASLCAAREAAALERERTHARELGLQLRRYNIHTARSEISRMEQKIARATQHIEQQAASSLPNLLQSLSALQRTSVLSGDYELKILRQNHYLKKQREIAALLLEQRAWHGVLSAAFVAEDAFHRETHALLASVVHVMKQAKETELRSAEILKRGRGDTTAQPIHTYMTHLHALCKSGDAGSSLVDNLVKLGDEKHNVVKMYAESRRQHVEQIKHMSEHIETVRALLYKDSATKMPLMAPANLTDAENALKAANNKLQQRIRGITVQYQDMSKDIEAKGNVAAIERELFTYFFNEPEELLRILEQLRQG